MNNKLDPRASWISYLLTAIITTILGIVLVKAEQLNWITTYESLQYVTGGKLIDNLDWNKMIADAVVILEIASLLTIFTPARSMKDEPVILQWIWALWSGSVIFDVFLTWFFVSVQVEGNSFMQSPTSIKGYVSGLFPVAVTLLLTLVQVGVLRIFGAEAEKLVNFVRTVKAQANTTHPMPTKAPMNQFMTSEQIIEELDRLNSDGSPKRNRHPNNQHQKPRYQQPDQTTFKRR